MIKAVIFDLDGTIMNSKMLRVEAWKHAFHAHGVELTDEQINPLIGLPGPDLAGKFSPKAFEIEMEEEKYFRAHLEKLELYGDVEDTFRRLEKSGIRTGVVTSSRKALMDILNLPFKPVVTIDDVELGKPDPEPYIKILKQLKVDPQNAMFVGDAETDLIPAREIGSVSVYIGHGNVKFSSYADYYVDEVRETERLVEKLNDDQKREDGNKSPRTVQK